MGTCGSTALDIKTYFAGRNQPTHPNVISFDTPWHGYRYYMAYTPYPYQNGFEENPCLAASNDLIHWETPAGLYNPIATCEELACDELKDSHLLYRKDLDRLEMWYLGRINGTLSEGAPLHCFRKVSADGRSWSSYEVMYTFTGFNLVSPSVIYDGGYLFWGIRHTNEDTDLYFMRSEDGIHWSPLSKCNVPNAVLTDMWHGTVIQAENRYHLVWVGYFGEQRQQIYYSVSEDGLCFTPPSVIVKNNTGWDYLYRPCLLKDNDRWYCYYGTVRRDGKWLISMSWGKDLDHLTGICADDLGSVYQRKEDLVSSSPVMVLRRYVKEAKALVVPRFLLCLPFLIVLRFLHCSAPAVWLAAILCAGLMALVTRNMHRLICRSFVMGTVNACIAGFAFEMLSWILDMLGFLLCL